MSRSNGGFYISNDEDDQAGDPGESEYHWRTSLTADHNEVTNTNYDQLPDEGHKRFFVSSWFTERPNGAFGNEAMEEWRGTIEVRDGSTNETITSSPEPDEGDYSSSNYSLSVAVGYGPVSIGISVDNEPVQHTDTYNGNQYWHHWDISTSEFPIGEDDAHGTSVLLETDLPPGESVTIAGWTSATFSWANAHNTGYYLTDTAVLGGFCDFDVIDDV